MSCIISSLSAKHYVGVFSLPLIFGKNSLLEVYNIQSSAYILIFRSLIVDTNYPSCRYGVKPPTVTHFLLILVNSASVPRTVY